MGLDLVPTGNNPPDEINVIIEIPKDADPVKYEVDKATGAIFVDRILSTPMRYPCNYGYVPHTVCGDGDPADVLVILPLPLIPGSVIRCRPVGVLKMTDEAGGDEKILAVPVDKVFAGYSHIDDIGKVSQHWLERIGVCRKRSTTSVPAALSISYLIGSPPIGTSMMTFTSSGGFWPILMASMRMRPCFAFDPIYRVSSFGETDPRSSRRTHTGGAAPMVHAPGRALSARIPGIARARRELS